MGCVSPGKARRVGLPVAGEQRLVVSPAARGSHVLDGVPLPLSGPCPSQRVPQAAALLDRRLEGGPRNQVEFFGVQVFGEHTGPLDEKPRPGILIKYSVE